MPLKPDRKPAELRTRRAIIDILKHRSLQDAAELAAQLNISAMAVRQHLYALRDEQLVAFEEEARPLGRPAKLWHLTKGADRFFPDGHADLALDLIRTMKTAFGAAGLDKLLVLRSREQVQAYGARIKVTEPLPKRLRALAEIRSEEGYMAEVKRADKGAHLFVENHCPICSAAAACTGICAAELDVFRQVLGPDVEVERVDHILAGARRCAYLVTRTSKSAR